MVIWTSIKGEGESFGWLLPVPQEPLALEPAPEGLFEMLDQFTAPMLLHTMDGVALSFILFLFLFGGIVLKLSKWELLHLFIVVSILGGLLFPAIGSPLGISEVSKRATSGVFAVGNYDAAILKPDSLGYLNDWLNDHQFSSLPENADEALQFYLNKGWYFIVGEIRHDSQGKELAPHPLYVSFEAEVPVYPMRLTALHGERLPLTLYLAGNTSYAVPGMESTFTSRLIQGSDNLYLQSEDGEVAGLPALLELLWSGAVLTRLEASDGYPMSLSEDIILEAVSFDGFHRQKLFTQQYILKLRWHAFVILAIALLGGFAIHNRTQKKIWLHLHFLVGAATTSVVAYSIWMGNSVSSALLLMVVWVMLLIAMLCDQGVSFSPKIRAIATRLGFSARCLPILMLGICALFIIVSVLALFLLLSLLKFYGLCAWLLLVLFGYHFIYKISFEASPKRTVLCRPMQWVGSLIGAALLAFTISASLPVSKHYQTGYSFENRLSNNLLERLAGMPYNEVDAERLKDSSLIRYGQRPLGYEIVKIEGEKVFRTYDSNGIEVLGGVD